MISIDNGCNRCFEVLIRRYGEQCDRLGARLQVRREDGR